jgi:putative hydrolase of the HAD superfamily
MIEWKNINTVLLDMDGTLLDLHFDNYFWREHVPLRFSEKHHISVEQARDELFPRFQKVEGTMDWYCIDYWTNELGLDIALLKEEVDHLIAVHPYVVDFLDAVRAAGKRVLLVTNAHGKSLSLKMDRTRLGGHFDELVCAHDLGLPKEEMAFWDTLKQAHPFEPGSTVLVDDSLSVLKSAREYGIKYLLAVLQPDTRGPMRDVEDFQAIHRFTEIMPIV